LVRDLYIVVIVPLALPDNMAAEAAAVVVIDARC
jgi:hypothetical protein